MKSEWMWYATQYSLIHRTGCGLPLRKHQSSTLVGFRKPIWWKLGFLVNVECIYSCGNLHNSICLVFLRTWSAVSASVDVYVLQCLYLELSIFVVQKLMYCLRNMSGISGGFCFWNLQMWRKEGRNEWMWHVTYYSVAPSWLRATIAKKSALFCPEIVS